MLKHKQYAVTPGSFTNLLKVGGVLHVHVISCPLFLFCFLRGFPSLVAEKKICLFQGADLLDRVFKYAKRDQYVQ
jgi:hypothetical protein